MSDEKKSPAIVFEQLKTLLHEQVISSVDFSRKASMPVKRLKEELRNAVQQLCSRRAVNLDHEDREFLVQQIVNEVFGFGPLEPLMSDPAVNDILVNGANNVFVEREGVLHATDVHFNDDEALFTFIQRMANKMGRRIDESSPMVDVRLSDGSRLNAVVPPLSLRGPALSIRRFREDPLSLEQMIQLNSMSADMAKFLAACVQCRVNLIVGGATGSGKTTLLNSMARFIPASERIITIEHTSELQLKQPNVVALEARPPNIEGRGEILVTDLLKNALRMRPDRIIVGECRGGEVYDVLQAMLTGHDGSMSTIHATDTREALQRIELMMALAAVTMPVTAARQYVGSAVRILVHLKRMMNGERKIMRISEVAGVKDGDYEVHDIYEYRQKGPESFGPSAGSFYCHGYRPKVLSRFREFGLDFSENAFEPGEQTNEPRRGAVNTSANHGGYPVSN